MKLETVKVVSGNEGGFVVINKSDFTNKHKLFKPKKESIEKVTPIGGQEIKKDE